MLLLLRKKYKNGGKFETHVKTAYHYQTTSINFQKLLHSVNNRFIHFDSVFLPITYNE